MADNVILNLLWQVKLLFFIKASEIYLEDKILYNSGVTVENGRIVAIGKAKEASAEMIDLGDLKLIPGFIDIHVHGGNNYDTMDATYEALNEISKYKLMEGVTAFCPTTVTSDRDSLANALECISKSKDRGVQGARIIGPFIEGPFINSLRKGAHSSAFINEKPDESLYDLVESYGDKVSVLIAPELDGAMDIIKELAHRDINIRLGHSNACYETAQEAVKYGASIAVHMFNAMAPLSAREPGLLGAGLLNDKLYTEVICDLVHSHKASLELLFKVKEKDKIILITDCMRAGGIGDGKFNLGEEEIMVENGIARSSNGSLAGSTLKMIDGIKNLHDNFNMELRDIINMATINPAKALKIDCDCGSIANGKQADIIAVDDNFRVKFVMIDGKIKKNAI